MYNLQSYKILDFDKYVRTLSEEAQSKLQQCIGRCCGAGCGGFCTEHIAKWGEMCDSALADFVTANQHIVPAVVAFLEASNPTLSPEFFSSATKLPLVVYNDKDGPAWCFNGKDLTYHPGNVALETFHTCQSKLAEMDNDTWQLMDSCCKERRCKDHCTEASMRHAETTRMRRSYTGPIVCVSIWTGKVFE